MLTMEHCALSFVKILNESKTFVKEQMQNVVDYILLKQTKNSDTEYVKPKIIVITGY